MTAAPVILAQRRTGGYLQYRIPALAATRTHVLCAYDARLNLDDLPAPIDLLLRRSGDSGRTWSEPRLVRSGAGFEGFGDPSLLVDSGSGRVFLFHSATVFAGFFESAGAISDTDPHVQHADVSVSEDGGSSWRHRRLSSALRRSGNSQLSGGEHISGMFATSGAGCQISSGPFAGRLVQPYVLRVGTRIEVACALSDDHGDSWRLGAAVPVTGGEDVAAELNESSAAALPDGTVVLHSRGLGARWQARSVDGAETFTPAVPTVELIDSGTNGSILAAGGALFASHSADPDLRRRAAISCSDDGGHTWREACVVAPGAAGYTQLAALPDGQLGIVYEANGYQQLQFQRYSPTALTAGLHLGTTPTAASADRAAAAAPGWRREVLGPLIYDVVLRSITPPEPADDAGPTHHIGLATYTDIPTTVFKEIGLGRGEQVQVVRTREGLRAEFDSRGHRPGLHPGEALTFHARVRNDSDLPARVEWLGDTRTLAAGEAWVRRDIRRVAGSTPAGTASELDQILIHAAPRTEAG